MFQITGCKKEKTKEKQYPVAAKIAERISIADTVFDKNNIYYPFIKENHPKAFNNEVVFFREADLDLDGENEAVIVFGSELDHITFVSDAFVLKNDNGKIREIQNDFKSNDLPINKVGIISLREKEQKYIYINYIDSPGYEGFSLYKLSGNLLKQNFLSASINLSKKEYEDELVNRCQHIDELIDVNKDGYFDGYVQNVIYNHLALKNIFAFEDGTFKSKKKYYVMEKYPDEIRDVVSQYIHIKLLDFVDDNCIGRLNELFPDKAEKKIMLSQQKWKLIYENCFSDPNPFIVKLNEDQLIANVSTHSSDPIIDFELKFELRKFGTKWQITKIEIQQ